jgi:gliding motility-associated-like protein
MYAITAEANNNVTQINYFDRCSGKMSKYKTIPWVFDSTYNQYMPVGSICFSPNNQFVYLINNVSIIQYNLNNDERIEICNDCRLFPHANILAKNAPDGKIYIGNLNPIGNKLSYIEFPDKNGVDAHYCRLCYLTKNNNTSSFSNMPNYELGALVGSPCDTIKPYVEPPPSTSAQIIVPSAISPNGDGKNDAWHILNVPQLQIAGITLQAVGVYNRWGNEVFKSNDINFSWDAKGWSNDTYYYYISYRTKAGTSQVMKGSVSVVR